MIFYTLERHYDKWVIWKNVFNQFSGGVKGVFRGSKIECKEYAKTHAIKLKKANLSINK